MCEMLVIKAPYKLSSSKPLTFQMRKLSLGVGELLAQDQAVRSGCVKVLGWRTYPFLREVSIGKVNENVSLGVKTALEQKAFCWAPA